MKKGVKNVRRLRATLVAGTMAAAIAVTGTLAWQSISQETINEFVEDANYGGRVHDDFNGAETKDVYAENFTDLAKGSPVFVRIRLEEYMEMGDDAGMNRTVTDDGGNTVTNPDRKATPLIAGADINDTSTWYIHKPDTAGETDPFHEYWTWDQDGSTIYMPTFNKNKDSLSVDVNGTYVGPDGEFNDTDPYQDYHKYTDGETKTGDAYYDADDDTDDEYIPGTSIAPGAGGNRKDDPGVTDPDYEAKNEEHTAKPTLNGLGYITMADWIDQGMPVCNKWVWDEDGWFYWPEPVQPQTATGLLLDRVVAAKSTSDKSYYAINIVGQFASEGEWGKPQETEKNEDGSDKLDGDGNPIVAVAAEGFYIDGITDNALTLLNQAVSVKVGEDGKWYLPQGHNLFKEIKDDEGTLGNLVCAGEDRAPGNTTDPDDRTDVVYAPDGITVGDVNYGNYFLEPRPAAPYEEPYYRGVGADGLLGTSDDTRLWLISGEFPTGTFMDKGVDTVTITAPNSTADHFDELEAGKGEIEIGTSATFTAASSLNGTPSTADTLVWTVEAEDGQDLASGTKISTTGVLTVDANETAKVLILTATSKLDNRYKATYIVNVYDKPIIKITAAGNATTVTAGGALELQAQLYRGDVLAPAADQPTDYTWSVSTTARVGGTYYSVTKNASDGTKATLSVNLGQSPGTILYVTAACGSMETQSLAVTVTDGATVKITAAENATTIRAGTTLELQARLYADGELASTQPTDYTWSVSTTARVGGTNYQRVNKNASDGTKATLDVGSGVASGITLYVTAACDGANSESLAVTVGDAPTVKITAAENATTVQAGGDPLELQARLYQGDELLPEADQPTDYTWSVSTTARVGGPPPSRVDKNASDGTKGNLSVAHYQASGTTLYVTAACDGANTEPLALTVTEGDPLTVTMDASAGTQITFGESLTYTATVEGLNPQNTVDPAGVYWSIGTSSDNGATIKPVTGATISDGTITISSSYALETHGDKLWVKAAASASNEYYAVQEITVDDGGTIGYDGVRFYVLYVDAANNRQLIITADILPDRLPFDNNTNAPWSTCSLRTWLNDTWLRNKTQLKAALADPYGTSIKTRKAYNSSEWDTSSDKVFLLSEADLFGRFDDSSSEVKANDYTVKNASGQGIKLQSPDKGWGASYTWMLRSPAFAKNGVAGVREDGTYDSISIGNDWGVRPALWVKIPTA